MAAVKKVNKKLNPRVRKLKKGKKSKRNSSNSSSDEGDKDHLLLQSCDDSFVLELLSSGDSPSKNKSKNMMTMMTTSSAGAAEVRRHPLSKLSNVSPFTPQPQKAPTPMAGVAPIPRIPRMASFSAIQLDYKSDPFVVHNIDPMEIQREDDDEEEEEEEEEDFMDCVDDMDDVENNQLVVPSVGATVSAQAQYVHFIKTVLSKRRPTNNTIQSKDKKHPCKGKRKLTKATESVIERIKNQAWEKLQREKRNQENRPVQCATVEDISSV